eukprot:4696975-Prorocentrum_lima.AAC.1
MHNHRCTEQFVTLNTLLGDYATLIRYQFCDSVSLLQRYAVVRRERERERRLSRLHDRSDPRGRR